MNFFQILLIVFAVGNALGQAVDDPWLRAFDSSFENPYSRLLRIVSSTNALPLLPSLPTPEQNLSNIVSRLKSAAPAAWSDMPPEKFVGHYRKPGPTVLGCRYGFGSLSGIDLFLFPDSTYIYAEWCDIMPLTIHGKGDWSASNGVVRLMDDGQLRSKYYRDAFVFLAVILTNTSLPDVFTNVTGSRLFLIEDERCLFRDYIRREESELVIGGLEHTKHISRKEMKALKNKLMKESWRPESFIPAKDD